MSSRRRHTTPVTQTRHARCSTVRRCTGSHRVSAPPPTLGRDATPNRANTASG
jgi:hypothetical protein